MTCPFQTLFKAKQPFIGFVMGGDGGVDYSVQCCLELIQGGVDILEIGFPFSDPIADGVVIQKASERALSTGTSHTTPLEIARRLRKQTNVPLVLFSYYNPLLKQGREYLHELKAAGFDAVLIVDLPPPMPHAPAPYFEAIEAAGLIPIYILTPSTSEKRLKHITSIAHQGFLYFACQKGTTGAKASLPTDTVYHVQRIKEISSLPLAIGFGIADRCSAKAAISLGDGFVVGSAFVKLMGEYSPPSDLKHLSQQLDPRSLSV